MTTPGGSQTRRRRHTLFLSSWIAMAGSVSGGASPERLAFYPGEPHAEAGGELA
jgi:hypothetical protein